MVGYCRLSLIQRSASAGTPWTGHTTLLRLIRRRNNIMCPVGQLAENYAISNKM